MVWAYFSAWDSCAEEKVVSGESDLAAPIHPAA